MASDGGLGQGGDLRDARARDSFKLVAVTKRQMFSHVYKRSTFNIMAQYRSFECS
jgi:hypothetical protein